MDQENGVVQVVQVDIKSCKLKEMPPCVNIHLLSALGVSSLHQIRSSACCESVCGALFYTCSKFGPLPLVSQLRSGDSDPSLAEALRGMAC